MIFCYLSFSLNMSNYEEVEEEIIEDNENQEGTQTDDSIVYDSSNFISKPIKSETCTVDENILRLHHSFGYDCTNKMYNLCAADEHTVLYSAGSYIVMFDVNSKSLSFRRCAGNGGIGHITKNPVFDHIAVGEKCDNPLIIIYEWPTFDVISVLKGSTKKTINWLTYSPNGDLLCSQGGEPDHTITIWDWKKAKIILKTMSHTQEVYICRFSTFIPDHLVTGGSGHIKFWKMANTFTGLKLKGLLGRFGKTEISSVIGILSMPNEKVLSGCHWGNILIWDETLIDVEIMRKGRVPCHSAPVIMLSYSETRTELMSVSMDGTINFWYFPDVDLADPPDDDRVVEIEPIFTIDVRDSAGAAKIMGMCKINDDPSSFDYFVQDGNGGIWLADLEGTVNAKPPKRLSKFHGDAITSVQASPVDYYIATVSLDGWFHVYDVKSKKIIFMHNFHVPITSMIWLPLNICCSGNWFVVGFQTGILKMFTVPLWEIMFEKKSSSLTEIQCLKPHTGSISHLTVKRCARTLMTASDDCTLFIYKIETNPVKLSPIGLYPLPGKVTYVHWKSTAKQTALISCDNGHIVEVEIPTSRPLYTKESFTLKLKSRVLKTVSIKSEIIRKLFFLDLELKKKDKIEKKKKELIAFREDNPGVEVDEELYFEDSDEEQEPPEIYIPPVPNPVLFAIYSPSEETIWVSIDGYDAGYLYEYDLEAPDLKSSVPINATLIPQKKNTSLTAIKILGTDSIKILMGFDDGRIRVTNVAKNKLYDLNDYIEYAVHDVNKGRVKMFCFSQDNNVLYTYGDDGNIFSFMFQCDDSVIQKCMTSGNKLPQSPKLSDKDTIKTKEDLKLSLEERKIRKNNLKAFGIANLEKSKIRCKLLGLKERFKQLLISNKSLPESLQFTHDDLQLDERITNSLIEETDSEMDKLKHRLAFDYKKSKIGFKKVKNYFIDSIITNRFEVKAIMQDASVKTIYHENRHNIFGQLVDEFKSMKRTKRQRHKSALLEKSIVKEPPKLSEVDMFLRSVRDMYPNLPKHIQNAIDKFSERKTIENTEILKIKTFQNANFDSDSFEDSAELSHAEETIGTFNLKTSPDYKIDDDHVISLEEKYDEYTIALEEIFKLKSDFNEKVIDLRQRKIKLIYEYKQFKSDIRAIQSELNDPHTMTPIDFPEVLPDKSIDPKVVDSFEPSPFLKSQWYLDLSITRPALPHPKTTMNGSDEKLSHLEIILDKMRKEDLKCKHQCLHDDLLTRIKIFDDYLVELEELRKDVALHITFLNLHVLMLEEELLILNDFDLLEDEYSYRVNETTKKQNEKVAKIIRLRADIEYSGKTIEKKKDQLIDIQQKFTAAVSDNDFRKHLKKIFKKKYKIQKVKSSKEVDDDDYSDSDSSSSSEDSDSDNDSDSDSIKSGENDEDSLTELITKIKVFDENVMPDGCDPQLFALTFELRSERHETEKAIEQTKKRVYSLNNNLSINHKELETIENKLQIELNELKSCRIEKLSKLNAVETTILFKTSQIAGINKFQKLHDCILVYGNKMNTLNTRVPELIKEKKQIQEIHKTEMLDSKKLRTEIVELEDSVKKYKVDIGDEMIKKFGMKTKWKFLDNMEMDLINYMIIEFNSSKERMMEIFKTEIQSSKQQIESHKDILTDLLRADTVKTVTLKVFRERVQELQQALYIQQKNNEKFQNFAGESSLTSDMDNLKSVLDSLLQQKREISAFINRLTNKYETFSRDANEPYPKVYRNRSIEFRHPVTPNSSLASYELCTTDEDDL